MNKKAFTFIEIMVVVALAGFLSAMGILNLLASRRTAQYSICLENRRIIENAETTYFSNVKTHSVSLRQLLDEGYLNKIPVCPSGGTFAWVPYESTSPYYQASLGCSFHGAAEEADQPAEEEKAEKDKKNKEK